MPYKGQHINGKWLKCINCGKTYWCQNSRIKKWNPKYCNNKCKNEAMIVEVKNKEEILNFYKDGNSVIKTSKKFLLSRSIIQRVLRDNGIRIRTRDHYTRGENSPLYKGGHITKAGYKRISFGGKQSLEHRIIIEKLLGRKLTKNEHVHHLNGNKLDNRLENLSVLTPEPHGAYHAKQYNDWKKMYQSRIAFLELKLRNCKCGNDPR